MASRSPGQSSERARVFKGRECKDRCKNRSVFAAFSWLRYKKQLYKDGQGMARGPFVLTHRIEIRRIDFESIWRVARHLAISPYALCARRTHCSSPVYRSSNFPHRLPSRISTCLFACMYGYARQQLDSRCAGVPIDH